MGTPTPDRVERGRTLSQLVADKGVQWVERQIRQRAAKDPAFRLNLRVRPRQAVARFFGVHIQDAEDGRILGLVIPAEDDE